MDKPRSIPTDLAVADLLEQEENEALERKKKEQRERNWMVDTEGVEFLTHGAEDRDGSDYGRLGYEDGSKRMNGRSSANGSVSSHRRSRSTSSRRYGDRRSNAPRRRSRSPDRYERRSNHRDRYDSRDDSPYDSYRHGSYRSGRDHRDHRDDRNRYSDHRPRNDRDGKDRSGRDRQDDQREQRDQRPALTEEEKDRRTVFCQQLAAALRTRELQQFFEQCGPVTAVSIVKDRQSGRSKGVGYVEFVDEESVPKAVDLTGRKLRDIPIIVQLTEGEKNRVNRTSEQAPPPSNREPPNRLYVGNINFNIGEDDLRDVFETMGEVSKVELQKDEGGRSKGFGFIEYFSAEHAKAALETMNSFELGGRQIRVGLGNDKYNNSQQSATVRANVGNAVPSQQGSSAYGMGGRGQQAGGNGGSYGGSSGAHKNEGTLGALDDNDHTNTALNNVSRASLMAKLSRQEPPKQSASVQTRTTPFVHKVVETRCICIQHAWSESDKQDPNWQEDLETDIKGECNTQYGTVKHIAVDPNSEDGEVYIKFENIKAATAAIRGLNGRYFGGQRLTAHYLVDAIYNVRFPKAAKL